MPPKSAGSPKKEDTLSEGIKRLLLGFVSFAKPLNKDGTVSIKQIKDYLNKDNNRETLKEKLKRKTIIDISDEVKNGNPNILVNLGLDVFLYMDRLLETYPQQQPKPDEETPKKKKKKQRDEGSTKKKKKKKEEEETPTEPEPESQPVSPIISPIPTRERTPSPIISQAQQARESLEQKLTEEFKSYNVDDDKKVSYKVSVLDNILELQKKLSQTVNKSESKQLEILIRGKYTQLAKDNDITTDEVKEHVSQHKEEKEGRYRPSQQYISETGKLATAEQMMRADIKREGRETRGEIQRATLATENEIKKALDEKTKELTEEFEKQKEEIISAHQKQLDEAGSAHRREMDTLRKKASAIAKGLKDATAERKAIEEKNIEENKQLREFLSEQHAKEIREIKAQHALTVGVIKKISKKQIDELKQTAKTAKEERKKIAKDAEQRDINIAEETKKRDEIIAKYNAERQEAIARAQAEKAELIAKQTEQRDLYMFRVLSTRLNSIDISIKKSILESDQIKAKLKNVGDKKDKKQSGLDSKSVDALVSSIPAEYRGVYGEPVRSLLTGRYTSNDIASGIIGISLLATTGNPQLASMGALAYRHVANLTGFNIGSLFSTSQAVNVVREQEEKKAQEEKQRTEQIISKKDKEIKEFEELIRRSQQERQKQEQKSQKEFKKITTLRAMPLVEQTSEISQRQSTPITLPLVEQTRETSQRQSTEREEQIKKLEQLIKTQSIITEELKMEASTREQQLNELSVLLERKNKEIKNIISSNIIKDMPPKTELKRRARSVPSLIKVTQELKIGQPQPLEPEVKEVKETISPVDKIAMTLTGAVSRASPRAIFNYIRDSKASEYVRRIANMIVDNYGSSIAGIPEEAWDRAISIARDTARDGGLPVTEEKVSALQAEQHYKAIWSDLEMSEEEFFPEEEPPTPQTVSFAPTGNLISQTARQLGVILVDNDEEKELGATSDIPEETLYQRLTHLVMGVLPDSQSLAERATTAINYIAELASDQKQRLFDIVASSKNIADIPTPMFNRAIDLIDVGMDQLGIPRSDKKADDVKRTVISDGKEISIPEETPPQERKITPATLGEGARLGAIGSAIGAGVSTGSAIGAVSGVVPGAIAGAGVAGVTEQLTPILAERLANSGLSATRQARILALAKVLPPSLLGLYMGYTPSGKVEDVVGRGVTSGAGITEQKITVTPDVLAQTKAQLDQDPSKNKIWQPKAITPTADILDVPRQEKYADDVEFIAFNYIPPTSEGAEGTVDTNPLKYQQLLESKIRYTDAGVYVPYVTWNKINDANNITDKRLRTMALGPKLPEMKFQTFDNNTTFENIAKWQYVNGENTAVEFKSEYADFSNVENSWWTNENNVLFTINP